MHKHVTLHLVPTHYIPPQLQFSDSLLIHFLTLISSHPAVPSPDVVTVGEGGRWGIRIVMPTNMSTGMYTLAITQFIIHLRHNNVQESMGKCRR